MAEVCQLLLEAGIPKFKCATIAEAEMLALTGAKDILLAYQPVGPKVKRLLALVKAFPTTQFSCLVDTTEAAQAISTVFKEAGKAMHVFLDLDVGMNRTGMKPGTEALALYVSCTHLPGITPVGLHAYDGHLRDTGLAVRKEKCDQAFEGVMALAQAIVDKGLERPILVAGGSPTFPIHAQRKGVECSPGTFIFWDWGYHVGLPEQPFLFAALVVSRVISRLDEETLCLDLGHKSIAAENPLPRVRFLNDPDVMPIGQSEEHLVVKVNPAKKYKIGDVFYGLPVHICPTCALYDQAHIVVNGAVKETWAVVARNRILSI
jgi:D-serine deaminase-like pyridoxal phosphate-dependent protein